MLPGQRSLSNVFESIQFASPSKAEAMHEDFMIVSLGAISATRSDESKQAADRLRRGAFDLPVIQSRVLESALVDLGY